MSVIIKTLSAIITAILTFSGMFTVTPYDKPFDTVNGGDPFIAEYEGNYYYTFTTGGGIDIFKTDSCESINVIDQKTVFRCGEAGTVTDIWAPEIHRIGNRWYIIACAVFDSNVVEPGLMPEAKEYTEHNDYYRYSFVLESNSEDVFGDYTFKGILAPGGLTNIDGTYLKKDGKLYFICSAYNDVANQSLYICEMENPYTLKTDEKGESLTVKISSPTHIWETRGWKVNEGPAVLYNGEDIYVLYSASGFSSGNYCMGMLTLTGDDVMKKCSWTKSPAPVVSHQPLKNRYNKGHCSFLYREKGDIYMVYHANETKDFENSPRLTYVKKVEFCKGVPIF